MVLISLLRLFQLWPRGALSLDPCVPSDTPVTVLCEQCLMLRHYKRCSRPILGLSCPALESIISSTSPGLFYLEDGIRNQGLEAWSDTGFMILMCSSVVFGSRWLDFWWFSALPAHEKLPDHHLGLGGGSSRLMRLLTTQHPPTSHRVFTN